MPCEAEMHEKWKLGSKYFEEIFFPQLQGFFFTFFFSCWLAQGFWLHRLVGCAWKQMSHVLLSSWTTTFPSQNQESFKHLSPTFYYSQIWILVNYFGSKGIYFLTSVSNDPKYRGIHLSIMSAVSLQWLWFTTRYFESCEGISKAVRRKWSIKHFLTQLE